MGKITINQLIRADAKIALGKGNRFLTPEQVKEVRERKVHVNRFEGGLPGNRKWRRAFVALNRKNFSS